MAIFNQSSSNTQAGLPHPSQGRLTDQLRRSLPQRSPSGSDTKSDHTSSELGSTYSICWNILWRIFDNVILLQMGSTYMIRFHELVLMAEGGTDLKSIDDWRKDQQAEWDRLSLMLALLATMHAAILAISPHPSSLAFALWLGGGTLSVCGLFIVQYFPVKAFSATDEDVWSIVEQGNEFFNIALLATAIASPVVICLWAAVLFVAGMVDYIIESDLGGLRYRIIAAVPVCFGIVTVIMTMILGETIDKGMRHKYYPQGLISKKKESIITLWA